MRNGYSFLSVYFTGIVKLLYNLLYFQVMAQLSCHLKESERNYFRVSKLDMSAGNLMKEFSLDHAMKLTIESMDTVQLYLEDGNLANFEEPARKTLELKVRIGMALFVNAVEPAMSF